MPGIGKSTIAARYVGEHPGVLNCDIDVLRTLVGGWQDDYNGAGGRIRSAALALVTAYLRGGDDVVLPQLIARVSEVERFERAAIEADASFVEVLLTDDVEARRLALSRAARRPTSSTASSTGSCRPTVGTTALRRITPPCSRSWRPGRQPR